MDYTLLKQITPQLPYLQPHSPYVRLTSMPARDLINPGIGQVIRLYDFYVPLAAATHNPYEIQKSDVADKKIDQEGYGDKQESESKNSENLESSALLPTDIEKDNSNEVEEPKIETKLDDGLLTSFQHPKIKVGKLVIERSDTEPVKKTPLKKNLKILKHKFHIV